MQRPIARAGHQKTVVYAVRTNGTSPGHDFYLNKLDDGDKAKMNALFVRMADHGTITNEEKFKKITGSDFYEFKSFQIRMPCYFLPGRLLVITHGFKKKSGRISPAEIDTAKRIKQEDTEHFAKEGDTTKWRT